MRYRLGAVGFIVLVYVITFFASDRIDETPTTQKDLIITNVRIDRLDALYSQLQPDNLLVVISGATYDACTQILSTSLEQADYNFTVIIKAVKPSDASCQQTEKPFVYEIPIDTSKLTPGNYTITGGDKRVDFTAANQSPTL